MYKFANAIELFAGIVNSFKNKKMTLESPLEEIVLTTSKTNLAYVDNRKEAKEEYNFDFWVEIRKQFKNEADFFNLIKSKGVNKKSLYSQSQRFPDFLFKVKKEDNKLTNGSLLELKDSKGGSIASFNSTLPTKYKSLDEIDIINGKSLVSRIASIMDGELASDKDYRTYQRRSFYLIRTYKNSKDKVKISIVDGTFFETVPKEHLFYQMFLNILRNHLKKKEIIIPTAQLKEIEKSLSYITDQTIIAASQTIEKASVRPRLRIMAEVHSEGNPHSSSYPEISERSFNLIIQSSSYKKEVEKFILERVPEIKVFAVQHKRNGEHIVFQFKLK
jgi:hypothetical protein